MVTLGQAIQKTDATTDKIIGIVASGDLSHRVTKNAPNGFHPQGAAFNQYIVAVLQRGKLKELLNMDRLLAREIGECGLRPTFCLMGILERLSIKIQVLSYEAPFDVGYAVAQFDVLPKPTDLARASLVHYYQLLVCHFPSFLFLFLLNIAKLAAFFNCPNKQETISLGTVR